MADDTATLDTAPEAPTDAADPATDAAPDVADDVAGGADDAADALPGDTDTDPTPTDDTPETPAETPETEPEAATPAPTTTDKPAATEQQQPAATSTAPSADEQAVVNEWGKLSERLAAAAADPDGGVYDVTPKDLQTVMAGTAYVAKLVERVQKELAGFKTERESATRHDKLAKTHGVSPDRVRQWEGEEHAKLAKDFSGDELKGAVRFALQQRIAREKAKAKAPVKPGATNNGAAANPQRRTAVVPANGTRQPAPKPVAAAERVLRNLGPLNKVNF